MALVMTGKGFITAREVHITEDSDNPYIPIWQRASGYAESIGHIVLEQRQKETTKE